MFNSVVHYMSQKVKLFFSAQNLLDVDVVTISDAFYQVTCPSGNTFFSECVQNDLNPSFTTSVLVFYSPGQPGIFTLTLKDHDPSKYMTSKNTFLGSLKFDIRQLMLCGSLTLPLEGVPTGEVSITYELVPPDARTSPKHALLVAMAEKLPEKRTTLQILRMDQSNTLREVKSTPQADGKDPSYTPLSLCLYELCKNNLDYPITFRILKTMGDMDKFDFVAEVNTTPNALLEARKENPVRLQLLDKKGKAIKSSFLIIEAFDTSYNYTMKDFINAGFQISLAACVDFSLPNAILSPGSNAATKVEVKPPVDKAYSRIFDLSETRSAHACDPHFLINKPRAEQSEDELESGLQSWKDNLFIRAFGRYLGGFMQALDLPLEAPISAFQTHNADNIVQLSGDIDVPEAQGIEEFMGFYTEAVVSQKTNMKSHFNHFSTVLGAVIAAEFPHFREPLNALDLKYPEESSIHPVFPPQATILNPLHPPPGKAPKFTALFYFTESDEAFGVKFSETNTPHFIYLDCNKLPLYVIVVHISFFQQERGKVLDIKRPALNQAIVNLDEVDQEYDYVNDLYDTVQTQVLDYLASYKVTPADLEKLNLPRKQ